MGDMTFVLVVITGELVHNTYSVFLLQEEYK
jgi:hypothetical protein